LPDSERRQLAAKGFGLIVDLRSTSERQAYSCDYDFAPDAEVVALEITHVNISHWEIFTKSVSLRLGMGGMGTGKDFFLNAYYDLVAVFSLEFRKMFAAILAAKKLPVLIHCASGKDRTGFAIALIMLALDMPVVSVYEEYLLSNLSVRPVWSVLFRPLACVKEEYLKHALDEAIDRYGSIDSYLSSALGITELERNKLKKLFLE
jgi:protein-tyrosine phosphatase